ncbi:Unknown protein [Striga hermonthica]|uniref:CCHC-type domain-containing protein n=1 Tax=Striga hermonthica TaxID=68872 RepID=A0A9N7RJP0_STRHE|nr:Unknown protein [Striga hermonthica]
MVRKKINFSGLKDTLSGLWRTQKPFTVRLVGYNLFQFVFQSEEDKRKILQGKTWSFDGQYILLKEWSSTSINWQDEAKINLWIQIHGLPLHWISEDTGLKIGKLFEQVSDVYVPDFGSISGRWIKILALIDLNEPLLHGAKINLGDDMVWVDFRYENLQTFCYYCGVIGHGDRNCAQKKEDIKQNTHNPGKFGEWLKASLGTTYINREKPPSDRTFQKTNNPPKPCENEDSNKSTTPSAQTPSPTMNISSPQSSKAITSQKLPSPLGVEPMVLEPIPTVTPPANLNQTTDISLIDVTILQEPHLLNPNIANIKKPLDLIKKEVKPLRACKIQRRQSAEVNLIEGLLKESGDPCSSQEEILNEIQIHFARLFNTTYPTSRWHSLEGVPVSITNDMNARLTRIVTEEELKRALHQLKKGTLQVIGDGKSTSTWTDPWLAGTPDLSPTPSFISDSKRLDKVCNLLNHDGNSWDKELIEQSFTPHEAQLILSTTLNRQSHKDSLIWRPHKLGKFTVKSAYSLILQSKQAAKCVPEPSTSRILIAKVWKITWSMKTKSKIKNFLWRCWHKFIGSQDQLLLKGIQADPICKVCGNSEESLEHILFSCQRAAKVWKLAGIEWSGMQNPSITFKNWWTDICNIQKVKSFNDRIHFSTFILWRLWKCRNLWIFNNLWKSEREIANQAWNEWMEFESISSHITLA